MLSRRFSMALFLIAGASALFAIGIMFGVGVVTAPPERKVHAAVERPAEPEVVRRSPVQIGADKALTPIYPASPGSPANASAETTGSGKSGTAEIATNEPQPVAPAVPDGSATQTAATDARPVEAGNPAPVTGRTETESRSAAQTTTLQKTQQCDIAACSAAYRSFRASDCTFQPDKGPRQLCENPPANEAKQASELSRREAAGELAPAGDQRDEDAELRAAVEAVRDDRATVGGASSGAFLRAGQRKRPPRLQSGGLCAGLQFIQSCGLHIPALRRSPAAVHAVSGPP